MNIPTVYEDKDVLAINKPAGLTVHKTHPQDPHETLADIIVRERPYLAGVGDLPAGRQGINLRPGIVHRLDKETSGVMVIAKNQPTFEYLKKQFQEHAIKKEYLALVYGRPKESRGTINLPLGKLGTKQTTQLKGKRELTEREAETAYETVRTFGPPSGGYTLLKVMPKTGRTHQIRMHLKAIGCPIVGDKLYAEGRTMPRGLNRMFLHAKRIELTAPGGKALVLEADLPEDLQNTLSVLQ